MALPAPSSSSSSLGVGGGGPTTTGAGGGPAPPTLQQQSDPAASPLASLRGVSAHGLVSLERAEGILQRVIDTVNDQALQISSLFLLVQTLVTSAGAVPGAEVRLPRCVFLGSWRRGVPCFV